MALSKPLEDAGSDLCNVGRYSAGVWIIPKETFYPDFQIGPQK